MGRDSRQIGFRKLKVQENVGASLSRYQNLVLQNQGFLFNLRIQKISIPLSGPSY